MFVRFYDCRQRYTEGFLKEYKHWVLEISYLQHTLGSFIVFAKRKGVENISDLKAEEILELPGVMREMEVALNRHPVFRPDKINYWQMGNVVRYLHFHGIPRYRKKRRFDGRIWYDKTFGRVPIWSKQEVEADLVRRIRDEIGRELSKVNQLPKGKR